MATLFSGTLRVVVAPPNVGAAAFAGGAKMSAKMSMASTARAVTVKRRYTFSIRTTPNCIVVEFPLS